MKNKKGISLIVLVITIIVIIVLATAVIVTFLKNNPISKANDAVKKWNTATEKEQEQLLEINWKLEKESKIATWFKEDTGNTLKKVTNNEGMISNFNFINLADKIAKDIYGKNALNELDIKTTYKIFNDVLEAYGYSNAVDFDLALILPDEYVMSKAELKIYMEKLDQLYFSASFKKYIVEDPHNNPYLVDQKGNKYYIFGEEDIYGRVDQYTGEKICGFKDMFKGQRITVPTVITPLIDLTTLYYFVNSGRNQKIEIGIVKGKQGDNINILADPDHKIKEGEIAWCFNNSYTDAYGVQHNDGKTGLLLSNMYLFDYENTEFYYLDDKGFSPDNTPF